MLWSGKRIEMQAGVTERTKSGGCFVNGGMHWNLSNLDNVACVEHNFAKN